MPNPVGHERLASIERGVQGSREYLLRTQASDGSWVTCLEGSVFLDSHFIIIDHLFETNERQITQRLAQRILGKQLPNGGVSIYPGDGGHLSTTVEAYLALSISGQDKQGAAMRRMREFILANGGIGAVTNLTKITLAACGQMSWSRVPAFPIELIHLKQRSPFSVYDFVSFTRAHIVPLMVLCAKSFSIPLPPNLGIRELRGNTKARSLLGSAKSRIKKLALAAHLVLLHTQFLLSLTPIRKWSLRNCERWILERLEPDGTLGSYILSTFYAILALRALGYANDDPIIQKALRGLRGFIYDRDGLLHMQPCTSAVWDTSLASYVLQESGTPADEPGVIRAAEWLIAHQAKSVGDGRPCVTNGGPAGCWGFQRVNELYPDIDDTLASVLAIRNVSMADTTSRDLACRRGIEWVVNMQNSDGGWASFERDCNKQWLERMPFNDMRRALTDPSTADMTGRTLEFLGLLGYTLEDNRVARAVRWLERHQERDGSWFGRWGIAYIYGTWTALASLAAVQADPRTRMIRSAVGWLESIQNPDGGWGESCASDTATGYVPLGFSTPSQTAWALMGLIASAPAPTDAIQRGVDHLLAKQRSDGSWFEDYPTGSGFAGKLYLIYHMYRNVWPLLALTRFRRKYGTMRSVLAGVTKNKPIEVTEDQPVEVS